MLHAWLNIAVLLAIVGAATFASCLGSTTFWGDE
jgi:hypothetical protein